MPTQKHRNENPMKRKREGHIKRRTERSGPSSSDEVADDDNRGRIEVKEKIPLRWWRIEATTQLQLPLQWLPWLHDGFIAKRRAEVQGCYACHLPTRGRRTPFSRTDNVLLLVVLEVQDDLGAVAEGTSLRAKACTCRLPTSVFGHCNPEDRKPGVMVFGVLGWCPAWGREEGPWPLAGRSGPRSPVGPVSTMQYNSTLQYVVSGEQVGSPGS